MPKGSQLWHTDGGPGTCINLMIVTSELQRKWSIRVTSI